MQKNEASLGHHEHKRRAELGKVGLILLDCMKGRNAAVMVAMRMNHADYRHRAAVTAHEERFEASPPLDTDFRWRHTCNGLVLMTVSLSFGGQATMIKQQEDRVEHTQVLQAAAQDEKHGAVMQERTRHTVRAKEKATVDMRHLRHRIQRWHLSLKVGTWRTQAYASAMDRAAATRLQLGEAEAELHRHSVALRNLTRALEVCSREQEDQLIAHAEREEFLVSMEKRMRELQAEFIAFMSISGDYHYYNTRCPPGAAG